MTSKRKAEIQRKLTLASVPRPPADLSERIKSDIPKYLNVESERARFSRAVGFNLRIAASVIVLVSSLLAMMFFFISEEPASMSSAAPDMKNAPHPVAVAQTTAASLLDEVQVEIAQEPPPSPAAPVAQIADASVAEPRREALRLQRADVERGVEGSVVGGVAGGMVGGVANTAVASAPAPVPPPAPPVEITVAAEAPLVGRRAESYPSARASQSQSLSLTTEAFAADLQLAPKSVFGFSVDPGVFHGIKNTIEAGGRPAPASVDVEALVNYFAGAPERRVRRGVRMEVEASPAPVESNGHRGILRVTIDTASIDVAQGGSVPPIAKNAHLEIELNRDAVRRLEPIGDHNTSAPEPALLHNVSVTGLYALDLAAPLRERDIVATIRLRYRSASDGKERTIVRVVRGADFAKQWARSSRRHRLASLGALWGESLRSKSGSTDVAKRAEELASQEPKDVRARELAAVATASSGGTH